jgi:hypothetical protein
LVLVPRMILGSIAKVISISLLYGVLRYAVYFVHPRHVVVIHRMNTISSCMTQIFHIRWGKNEIRRLKK